MEQVSVNDPPEFVGDDGELIGADAMHALLVEHALERTGRAPAPSFGWGFEYRMIGRQSW